MFRWFSPFALPQQVLEQLSASGGCIWSPEEGAPEAETATSLLVIYPPPHAALGPPALLLAGYQKLHALRAEGHLLHLERLLAHPVGTWNRLFSPEPPPLPPSFSLEKPAPLQALITLALLRERPALLDAYLDLELSSDLGGSPPDSEYALRLRESSSVEALLDALRDEAEQHERRQQQEQLAAQQEKGVRAELESRARELEEATHRLSAETEKTRQGQQALEDSERLAADLRQHLTEQEGEVDRLRAELGQHKQHQQLLEQLAAQQEKSFLAELESRAQQLEEANNRLSVETERTRHVQQALEASEFLVLDLRRQLQELEQAHVAQQQELEDLHTELEQLIYSERQNVESLDRLEQEAQVLRKGLRESAERRRADHIKLDQIQNELVTHEALVVSQNDQLAELQAQRQGLEENCAALQVSLENLLVEHQTLQADVAQIRQERDSLKAGHDLAVDQCNQLDAQVRIKVERCLELESQLADHQRREADLEDALQQMLQQASALESQRDQLQQSHESQLNALEQSAQQRAELQAQRQGLEENCAALQVSLKNLQVEHQALQVDAAQIRQERDSFKAGHDLAVDQCNQLDAQVRIKVERCLELETQLADHQRSEADLEDALQQMQQQASTLESQRDQLQQSHESQQTALEQSAQQLRESHTRLEESLQSLLDKEIELERLRVLQAETDFQGKREQKLLMERQVDLEKELDTLRGSLQRDSANLEHFREENQHLLGALHETEEELEHYILQTQHARQLMDAQQLQLQRAAVLMQRMAALKGITVGVPISPPIQVMALLEGYRHSLKRAERLLGREVFSGEASRISE
jgi:chromosome segregation ATPase